MASHSGESALAVNAWSLVTPLSGASVGIACSVLIGYLAVFAYHVVDRSGLWNVGAGFSYM